MSESPKNWAQLCTGFWPAWNPSKEQSDTWRERCGEKKQAWLAIAIERHFAEDEHSLGPRLSKVLQHYAAIAEAGASSVEAKAEGNLIGFRATWTRTVGTAQNPMSSSTVFGTEREAFAHAERMCHWPDCSRPGAMVIGVPPKDCEDRAVREEVESDDDSTCADLVDWPNSRIERAVKHASALAMLQKAPTESDQREWTRWQRGIVHAADWHIENRIDLTRAPRVVQFVDGGTA